MEIIEIAATTTRVENPYTEDVKTLIEATKNYTGPADTAPGGVFRVPNAEAKKTVFYVQQAAIAEGVTARIASPQINGQNSKGNPERTPAPEVDAKGKETGETVLVFKIAPKRKENGRKPRGTESDAA